MSSRIAEIRVPPQCREMIRAGALVAINSSGGKDSQCMTILLSRLVPRDQLLVVHAPLGEVEWPGTIEHIEATLPASVPLIFAPVASGKTLLERVEERGLWPSNSARWCTSDFKAGPIQRELRRFLKANPALRRAAHQRHGHARGRKPGTRQEGAMAAQRPNERRGPRSLRLAAGLPSFDGRGVPRHPRRRSVAALGLRRRHVEAELQLLHPGVPRRSAPGGRAPPGPLPHLHRT